MDIFNMGIGVYLVITVLCYLICMAVRCTSIKENWLPVIAGVAGAALGIAAFFTVPDFPADTILDSIAVGIVSGIAATGVNQVYKQLVEKRDEIKGATKK